MVFVGAYLVEKARGFALGRAIFHFLAMLPMAVPGLVLGLAYIFFFNAPREPAQRALPHDDDPRHQHRRALLHRGPSDRAHRAAADGPEFETVSASLKQPFYRTFWRVTVPVCLPAILDIAIYMFVNAMTTVSGVVFLYGPKTELASISVLEHGRHGRDRLGRRNGHDDLLHERGRPHRSICCWPASSSAAPRRGAAGSRWRPRYATFCQVTVSARSVIMGAMPSPRSGPRRRLRAARSVDHCSPGSPGVPA